MANLEEHLKKIQVAIRAAEADGLDVTLENDCCGCSEMTLEISYQDSSTMTVIFGERRNG